MALISCQNLRVLFGDRPLLDDANLQIQGGERIGLIGTTRSYGEQQAAVMPEMRIAPAVEHLRRNYRERLQVEDLAERAGLSKRQFDRVFGDAFGVGPQEFLIRLRVQRACEELREREVRLGDLAQELGFCDQSSFTQHFRKRMGETPLKYQKRYREK